ncbi:Putative nucleotide-binding alpha-beta plait domain superfamily [Septoria linicola]|uniref:Nucleotide-binding alpha-beta plait domain superfamily n=1 Tax=Septoria linicola TaxID=215465 RepID=A0A9Q9AKM8_9PEZI|nr:putative nucleotide-binding alpha-beta plait domain superfamily [Septoria linicola]USW48698.1 Putative nucleotide-binding alpha-beta plait domain superfamily [Septoria linicola]
MYQAYSLRQQHRPPGMQIHAVPEAERALDSTGRKLPWGYDYSGPIQVDSDRSVPAEKGPFGKSMRNLRRANSRSRSTTAIPRQNEDARTRQEQLAAEDAVFGSLRRVNTNSKDQQSPDGAPQAADQSIRAPAPPVDGEGEPTEVILYGFGEELQWAAIDFYERVSHGIILEDYDRVPEGARYAIPSRRLHAQRSLSRVALGKKNAYKGGNNWIKITFNNRSAADLAVARSPHTIKGYLVYAEMYNGRGPSRDMPIHATQAGAQLTSEVLPATLNTDTTMLDAEGSPNGSSQTATSATATNATASRTGRIRGGLPWSVSSLMQDSPTNSSNSLQQNEAPGSGGFEMSQIPNTPTPIQTSSFQPRDGAPVVQHRQSRLIEGTVRLVPKSPELALAPKQPKASWTSWLGTGEIIGGAVPRRHDGSFDWEMASLYWRICAWFDWMFGTDLCGLKGDE